MGSRGILRSATLVAWRLLRPLLRWKWNRGPGGHPVVAWIRSTQPVGSWIPSGPGCRRDVPWPDPLDRARGVRQVGSVTLWAVGSPSKWLEPLGISGGLLGKSGIQDSWFFFCFGAINSRFFVYSVRSGWSWVFLLGFFNNFFYWDWGWGRVSECDAALEGRNWLLPLPTVV